MKLKVVLQLLFLFILSTLAFNGMCQKEANQWYFGNHAGLDFNSGSPVLINTGVLLSYDNSTAISDSIGNILFYSDGMTIWDNTNSVMSNGSGLVGSNNGGQCALIVPQPQSTLYYVFTVDDFSGPNGFNYSIVDISLNGGLGQVISKNNQLFTPSTERLDSYYNCSDNSYWILTHRWGSNNFNAYKLSSTGLNTVPVVSSIGFSHSGSSYNAMGQLTISPDGTMICCAVYTQGIFELFDFDINTGIVSNPRTISGQGNAWGVAFSPDNTKLYTTIWFGTAIYQFDLNAGSIANITASKISVGNVTGPGSSGYYVGFLQLAPDNKIYAAKFDDDYIAAINSPNTPGLGCGFVDNAVNLGVKTCKAGLCRMAIPNYPENFVVTPNGFCIGDTTFFTINNLSTINSIHWNFGDVSSGASNTDSVFTPYHVFSSSGNFVVTAIIDYKCFSDTVNLSVTISDKLNAIISGADTICSGDTVILTASGGTTYQWSGGISTTDSVIAVSPSISTNYILEITNGNCGSVGDTLTVTPILFQAGFISLIDTHKRPNVL
jgi:hypothetical protein